MWRRPSYVSCPPSLDRAAHRPEDVGDGGAQVLGSKRCRSRPRARDQELRLRCSGAYLRLTAPMNHTRRCHRAQRLGRDRCT